MQIVESFQAASSQHLLIDEIYAPNLSSASNMAASKAAAEEQQHLKAINELHRFLESSCDCV